METYTQYQGQLHENVAFALEKIGEIQFKTKKWSFISLIFSIHPAPALQFLNFVRLTCIIYDNTSFSASLVRFKRAMKIRVHNNGRDHHGLARPYHMIGMIYNILNKWVYMYMTYTSESNKVAGKNGLCKSHTFRV